MKVKVLALALVMLLLLASQAVAYRVITVPSGTLLAPGMTRAELASCCVSGTGFTDGWFSGYKLDSAVSDRFELQINLSDPPSKLGGTSTYTSLQWVAVPTAGQMPQLSIGSWNIGNNDRQSFYAVASKDYKIGGLPGPVSVHLGWGSRMLEGAFGGAIIPVGKSTQVAFDYVPWGDTTSGKRVTARPPGAHGLELAIGHNFTPEWRVKAASVGGHLGLGLVFTSRLNLVK